MAVQLDGSEVDGISWPRTILASRRMSPDELVGGAVQTPSFVRATIERRGTISGEIARRKHSHSDRRRLRVIFGMWIHNDLLAFLAFAIRASSSKAA
jgi:hypothetical protein